MRSYLALLATIGFIATHQHPSEAQPISQADLLQYRDEEFRFSIHYPRSWATVEATHAQTRFKAVSNGGTEMPDLSVVVTSLPRSAKGFIQDEFVKSIDVQAYLEYMRQSIPNAELIEHGQTMLSNQPAYYFVIQFTHRFLGIEVPVRQIQVQTARERNVYTITFRTDPEIFAESFALFEVLSAGFILWPEPPNVGIAGRFVQSPRTDVPSATLVGGLRTLVLIGLFALGAVFLRFVVIRRALSKTLAFGTVAPVWLALHWFHYESGRSSIPSWVSAGAVLAILILASGQKSEKPATRNRDDSDGSSTPSVGAH